VSSVRNRLGREEGFTLVEVLVAITLLGLVAAAMLPLLLIGARASTVVKHETEAKNVAQERLEQMRQLAYQVDRQNGPFIDLLDNYYPNRTAATGTGAGWVSGTAARLDGEPATGSFYRVVFDPVPGSPGFRQTVASQFLRADRAPVPDASFTTYNSQLSGVDAAPSNLLGVTVITTWQVAGTPKRFEVFTQIADQGRKESLIASQAQVTALRVESSAPDGSSLSAVAGSVNADGRLSDGSSAAVRAEAGRAASGSSSPVLAANQDALSPGTAPAGTPSLSAVTTGTACGYGSFGRSVTTGVTAATTGGLPQAPSTVGTTTTPAAFSSASLLANSGGSCGTFGFGNLSSSYDAALQLRTGVPLINVPDDTNGNTEVLYGRTYINASPDTAASPFVAAGARAGMVRSVDLLPTTFVTDGRGVVSIKLDSARLDCLSTGAAPTASYTVSITYWNGTSRQQLLAPFTWSSTTAATDPLAGLNLATVSVGGGKTLADYIASWSFGTSLSEGSTNGVAGLDAAIRVTTRPVRASDPTSSFGLVLGAMSCVADDNR
jgi:prepilin-type N-terminal cleavage/methylation domain-containing protein